MESSVTLDTKKLILLMLGLIAIATALPYIIYSFVKVDVILGDIEIPETWDKSYTENVSDYETQFEVTDWSTIVPNANDVFTTVTLNTVTSGASFTGIANAVPKLSHMTDEDRFIAQLTENAAWDFISNGIFKEYSTASFAQNKSKLQQLQKENMETISVRCWYWANPSDDADMSKLTVEKTFAVNSSISNTFQHIFQDIYDDPSKPVINIADGGMGTWVLRGKNHNASRTMSAHSLGVAIDINPGTGSFYVNGTWYGNAYGQKKMSSDIWSQLPECHKKYHVLYEGSPIVEIFKSYGFYWGGDWLSGTDCMHLSYIGDGSNSRQTGITNYKKRCN